MEAERGRVIVMHADGNEAIADALRSGVMSARARWAVEKLIRENAQISAELEDARRQLDIVSAALKEHQRADMAARTRYMERRASRRLDRSQRRAMAAGLVLMGFGVGASLMMLAVMHVVGGL